MTHLALFFHLLGAFLFVSGAVVAGIASEAARRRDDVREMAVLLGIARKGAVLVGAGAILLLGFGIWLTERTGGFRGWVDATLALFIVSAVLGGAGGRRPRHARVLARSGGDARDVRLLLDDPWSRSANAASGLLVLAILALMIWQP